jgi:hypothetical protein
MEILPGFRMRPPQDEDADEVAAFANEECIAFLGALAVRSAPSSTPARLQPSRE